MPKTKIPAGGWTKRQQANHRKKWVAALRSGEYKQGKGALVNDGFCCLGVACDISGLAEWEYDDLYGWTYLDNTSTLPDKVMDWLGIRDSAGYYGSLGDAEMSLTGLNDSGKKRFRGLANIIEAEPPGLVRD